MIVVTGMHRSGTSLLAMWLNAAGLPAADEDAFYGADQHNERGYFEERAVIDINSYLLSGQPRTAGAPARLVGQVRYLARPSENAVLRRAAQRRDAMEAVVSTRAAMLVKDPRFCLTVRAWQDTTGAVEACVVAVRDPASVVRSLYRRQRIPARLGYRFWDAHIEAILNFEPDRTCFVDMDKAMAGDVDDAVQRLAAYFEPVVSAESLRSGFRQTYSADLVRSNTAAPLPERTERLYRELQRRCLG